MKWDCAEMLEASSSKLGIPDLQFEEMAALFRYWEAMPGDKARQAVDPVALGSQLLPHVSLGSLVDGCNDFRYDLISSEMKIVAPRLRPGDRSSDALRIQKTQYDLVHDLFMSTGRSIEPKILRITYASMEDVSRGINTLFLPLGRQPGANGKDVARDLMIGLWRFKPAESVKHDYFEDILEEFIAYLESSEEA